jgi:ATP-binding cassette subfamily B protein
MGLQEQVSRVTGEGCMKKWTVFRESPGRVLGLMGGSALSNIPRGLFMGFMFMIVTQLTTPLLQGNSPDLNTLRDYTLIYAGIFLVYFVLTLWSQTNNYVQAYRISTGVRLKLGDKLRRLSLGFFKAHDPGDVTARILHDVSKAEHTLSHTTPDVVTAAVVPLLLGVFLVRLSSTMTMVLFLGVLVSAVFMLLARLVISRLGRKHILSITETSSRILEYAGTVKLLKAFGITGSRFETLDSAMLKLKKLSFQAEVFTGIPVMIALYLLDLSYFVALYTGIPLVSRGSLPLADLFSFAIIGYYFLAPVKQLWIMLVLLRHANLSAQRIGEVFNARELPVPEKPARASGTTIEFSNVGFSYGDLPVLRDISCVMPQGRLTALVGHSGSGKTTMVNLIARFWDVDSGSISVGGVPVTSMRQEDLLAKVSMVFQDVYLFNDTVAGNIRVGKQDATMAEVMRAARLARCHEFIEKLPEGYDTMVSEGGSSLSGGEKQRISIARAILKDAPIILLDEATASLDPENEAEIQDAFENLTRNKTIVVIAHRFSTIRNADRILVLSDGAIAEQGTHEELVELGGVYSSLWSEQQKTSSWKLGA